MLQIVILFLNAGFILNSDYCEPSAQRRAYSFNNREAPSSESRPNSTSQPPLNVVVNPTDYRR